VIAKYDLLKATEEFCCEDEHCEYYIRLYEPYIQITELNDDGDVLTHKKCLPCAIETIKDETEELYLLLKKLENT
jgi:hypothetical protein